MQKLFGVWRRKPRRYRPRVKAKRLLYIDHIEPGFRGRNKDNLPDIALVSTNFWHPLLE